MLEDNQGSKYTNPEQFYSNLQLIYENMLLCQKNGDYNEAENLRLKAFQYKKKWQEQTLEQMNLKFSQAMMTLQFNYNSDLQQTNTKWTTTLNNYVNQCKQYIDRTDKENLQEISTLRRNLNEQLPSKVKESYQLLNLRQMEHHMSKQKDFTQAHLVQNRIKEVYNAELTAWNQDKNKKIQQAVTNLKNKHAKERELFSKKMQIHLQDHNNNWHQEKVQLNNRFNNNSKQLKASHQRQVGSFKRQFKTKGGMFSSKYEDSITE